MQGNCVRLQELALLAQSQANVRYVYFKSADGYYESWDLASAVHPQTLMAFQRNGQPLSVANGAPLRLAPPIKPDYKLSKWVDSNHFFEPVDANERLLGRPEL